MTVVIASAVLAEILSHADATPAEEVCGILFGERTGDGTVRVTAACRCANIAADPARRFEIDPAALLAAYRAARSGGPAVVGHYHSHPGGLAYPSPRDAADAMPDGRLWIIVAGQAAGAWRAVAHGAIHGRFEALALRVER